ncbi:putative FBD-associated F-box protein At5g22720 [Eutrema salsugineum]|uniref:putative FBD-associated F-box protein At5g22720 n=1 Tax=Eutrema salsugineum TaxID=72664 RepID=UPI000CED3D4C|nr:putative FBD-associated F-box protein At5g22720 [Eutrema salsugineum]
MQISYVAYEFMEPFSPQFSNLSCLKAEIYTLELETLPMYLASCPNLRSLILEVLYLSGFEQTRFSFVPQCLLSSLEFVEIKSRLDKHPIVTKLVSYFVENSVVLKKLVLDLAEDSVVVRDLLALPRRSSECQIVVC